MIDDDGQGRVALDSDAAIFYWTRRFNVSRDEVEEAIEVVGDHADAVAAYLNVRI